jgi:hypothetical protein
MKRSLLVLTAAAVVLSPLAATAAPAKATKRTVTYEYSGFSNVGGAGLLFNASAVLPTCELAEACWDFKTTKGEKTIEITASDPKTGFQVFYDGAFGGDDGNVVTFCGKGKITVSPKTAHEISVRPSLDECGGATSSGTMTAVITGIK